MRRGMEFRILGPLEVHGELGAVGVGRRKPRAVLAVLLLHRNEPVSAERLALALWGDDAPAGATRTVQVYVSRLRKALGDAEGDRDHAGGLPVRVRPGELDAERFERCVEDGRRALGAGQPERRRGCCARRWGCGAGRRWRSWSSSRSRGPRSRGSRSSAWPRSKRASRPTRRRPARRAGRRAAGAGRPSTRLRERLAAQLMLALYRCGRQAEALEAYREARGGARRARSASSRDPSCARCTRRSSTRSRRSSCRARRRAAATSSTPTGPPLVGRDAELARLREPGSAAREATRRCVAIVGGRRDRQDAAGRRAGRRGARAGARRALRGGRGRPARGRDALPAARRRAPTLLVARRRRRAAERRSRSARAARELARAAGAGRSPSPATPERSRGCRRADVPRARAARRRRGRAIAARYAPRDARGPARDGCSSASGGVPRRVHELASRWARREAARRVDAARRARRGRSRRAALDGGRAGGRRGRAAGRAASAPGRRASDDAPVRVPVQGPGGVRRRRRAVLLRARAARRRAGRAARRRAAARRRRPVRERQVVGHARRAAAGAGGRRAARAARTGRRCSCARASTRCASCAAPLAGASAATAAWCSRSTSSRRRSRLCRDERERARVHRRARRAGRDRGARPVVVLAHARRLLRALRGVSRARAAARRQPRARRRDAPRRAAAGDRASRAARRPARRARARRRAASPTSRASPARCRCCPRRCSSSGSGATDGGCAWPPTSRPAACAARSRGSPRTPSAGSTRAQQAVARRVLLRLAARTPRARVERRRVALAELEPSDDEDVARVARRAHRPAACSRQRGRSRSPTRRCCASGRGCAAGSRRTPRAAACTASSPTPRASGTSQGATTAISTAARGWRPRWSGAAPRA